MKIKKLTVAILLLAITLVVYAVASVLCCYTTKPEVSEGSFAFSITYEYKGEIKTHSGVYECKFAGSNTIQGEHNRYWDGEIKYENPENLERPHVVDENEEQQTLLAVQPSFTAGYFMGDPLYKDEIADTYVEYYDYINDISLDEYNQDEILSSIGFKIIDVTYAEPIENSFSFSGISYEAYNVIIYVAISLAFLVLCLIFVRKDDEYQYTSLDKAGIIANFLVGVVALPIITLVCIMFGLVESSVPLINQLIYSVPPVAIIALALSVVLRRKGFSRTGFFIQLAGIEMFVLLCILETFI